MHEENVTLTPYQIDGGVHQTEMSVQYLVRYRGYIFYANYFTHDLFQTFQQKKIVKEDQDKQRYRPL